MFDIEIKRAASPFARLFLAHGAGAGKEHEFMQSMSLHLTNLGIDVVLFNFAYMQTIKATGKRRPPDKADKLLQHFADVICDVNAKEPLLPLFIGGKSMGGRMATMLLSEATAYQQHQSNEPSVEQCEYLAGICGAIALGYPFHPPGKPEKTRTAHLETLTKPLLVMQGERDTFGTKADISTYSLSSSIKVKYLPDGDHSFKPRKASGYTQESHIQTAAEATAKFIKAVMNERKSVIEETGLDKKSHAQNSSGEGV